MLCETNKNWRRYDFGPTWRELMSWLTALTPQGPLEPQEVAGCAVKIIEERTKPFDGYVFETHRRMVDVQMPLAGEEWLYVAPAENLPARGVFDTDRDIGFHVAPQRDLCRVSLKPGVFALLFPWDAHMPMVAVDNIPATERKIVCKIPFDKMRL